MVYELNPKFTPGAEVRRTDSGGWRLSLPGGPGGQYRLAQLDDYTKYSRRDFPWRPPVTIQVTARASATEPPGTWGFGLWNDPFSLSLGLKGSQRRLPALPNAAWFFVASVPNYLSLQDHLPAQGPLAATFYSPPHPALAALLPVPLLPLLALPLTARWLRHLGRRVIRQDAVELGAVSQTAITPPDLTAWHTYALTWDTRRVTFSVDHHIILETQICPIGPLGLVLWIDNQYAAWPPDGRLSFGTLPNQEPVWLELENLKVHV